MIEKERNFVAEITLKKYMQDFFKAYFNKNDAWDKDKVFFLSGSHHYMTIFFAEPSPFIEIVHNKLARHIIYYFSESLRNNGHNILIKFLIIAF